MGTNYIQLLIARSLHGISSAGMNVAGFSALANKYKEDSERSLIIGLAMSGVAGGVIVGYPLGGSLYEFVGKSMPFAILTSIGVIQLLLQFTDLQESNDSLAIGFGTNHSFYDLLKDFRFIVLFGALLLPEVVIAAIEPTLPRFLEEKMKAEEWEVGAAFLPDSLGFLIGSSLFTNLARKIGRKLLTSASLLLMSACLIGSSYSRQVAHLILPQFGVGLGLGGKK